MHRARKKLPAAEITIPGSSHFVVRRRDCDAAFFAELDDAKGRCGYVLASECEARREAASESRNVYFPGSQEFSNPAHLSGAVMANLR